MIKLKEVRGDENMVGKDRGIALAFCLSSAMVSSKSFPEATSSVTSKLVMAPALLWRKLVTSTLGTSILLHIEMQREA